MFHRKKPMERVSFDQKNIDLLQLKRNSYRMIENLLNTASEDETENNTVHKENYIDGKLNYFPHLESNSLTQRLTNPSGKSIPDKFDPWRLTLLSRHQVAFWDETHPKVIVSTRKIKKIPNGNVEVKFHKKEKGHFNISSGCYEIPNAKIVNLIVP